jgi:hypothetical protein
VERRGPLSREEFIEDARRSILHSGERLGERLFVAVVKLNIIRGSGVRFEPGTSANNVGDSFRF